MKKHIKNASNFIRRFSIMVIIIIMVISAICTVVASNFSASYIKYQMAESKINSIVRKADRGHIYDPKNGYIVHWTDKLREQHQNAIERKIQISRSNDFCRWINLKQNHKFKVFEVFVLSLITVGIGIFTAYASFLALTKKIADWHEFNTNPMYYDYWDWKKKYQYYTENKERKRRKEEAMEWIRGLN